MRLYSLLLFFALLGCRADENTSKSDQEAIKFINQTIEAAGGLENLQSIDSIQFVKITKLYKSDGAVEDSTYQIHTYYFKNGWTGKFEYEEGEHTVEVFFDGENVHKVVDGRTAELDDDANEKLKNSFLASQFVILLPFKLKDNGVKYGSLKKANFNGQQCYEISAEYNKEYPSHTKSHTWWHYFDLNSYEHLGYRVHHAPTYAEVVNESMKGIHEINWPTYRRTYRIDEGRNRTYLRAEFWYNYF